METVTVSTGWFGVGSSVIVPIPCPSPIIALALELDRFISKVSFGSIR